jgi:hypothetical protein
MLTSALFDYISENRKNGFSDLTIMRNLSAAGWSQSDIEDAFNQLKGRIIEGESAPDSIANTVSFFKIMGIIIFVVLFIGGGIAGAQFLRKINSSKIIPSVSESKQQADLVSMHTSLSFYYAKYEKYPTSLDELLTEKTSLVKDPKIIAKFDYAPKDNYQNYSLCETAASGDQTCVTKDDDMLGFGDTPTPESPMED